MSDWINIAYLAASVLFIVGLKGLTRPRTAVRGNQLAAAGMAVAVAATLLNQEIVSFTAMLIAVAVGAAVGVWVAQKVAMTEMPELVALFNGLGGAASLLVAFAEMLSPAMVPLEVAESTSSSAIGSYFDRVNELANVGGEPDVELVPLPFGAATLVSISLAAFIGAVTLSGSLIAFGKLSGAGWADGMNASPLGKTGNAVLLGVCLLLAVWCVANSSGFACFLLIVAALVLGVGLVAGIGGADMPVVIALLNSYSGLAASATGFVLSNNVLIISGALVGASGMILTQIMCKAMNRSLANVLFGGIDAGGSAADADAVYADVKQTSADEVAMLLEDAQRVAVIPGYGMAVAQAQHAVRDLASALAERGCEVVYGIHPVAGRMPGHMNVLLAEADIPYESLVEMDEINTQIGQFDVALVVGANDTVNPDARTNPQSPIAGMPIIDVDKARTVVVVKRSLSPGYAGIPNPLFAGDNTLMLFADGKQAVVDIKTALAEA